MGSMYVCMYHYIPEKKKKKHRCYLLTNYTTQVVFLIFVYRFLFTHFSSLLTTLCPFHILNLFSLIIDPPISYSVSPLLLTWQHLFFKTSPHHCLLLLDVKFPDAKILFPKVTCPEVLILPWRAPQVVTSQVHRVAVLIVTSFCPCGAAYCCELDPAILYDKTVGLGLDALEVLEGTYYHVATSSCPSSHRNFIVSLWCSFLLVWAWSYHLEPQVCLTGTGRPCVTYIAHPCGAISCSCELAFAIWCHIRK